MKADELEDLQVYSKVFDDYFTRISVLLSLLENLINQAGRCIKLFKENVDEKALQNARKNH